jgi:ribonuclease BN (tRNA processing enzyme)
MNQGWALRFIGTGASNGGTLGHSAAVLERSGEPVLLIDCGQDALPRFHGTYGEWPRAIFITHVHLDHISGLEQLHGRIALGQAEPVRLYVPTPIIRQLHERIANLPNPLAEGRKNFWDRFRVIPVAQGFWHEEHWFDVFEVRHHAPGFAHGLRLPGHFLYTGDTRPIPEVLRHYAGSGERIFHDCSLKGNPSHTGLDDIQREYEADLRDRLVLYHYESEAAAERLVEAGFSVARPGQRFMLGAARHLHAPPVLSSVPATNGFTAVAPGPDLSRRGFE